MQATAHMQELAYILARMSIRTRISLTHKQVYIKTHLHKASLKRPSKGSKTTQKASEGVQKGSFGIE